MQLIDLTDRYNIIRDRLELARVDGGAWHHSVTKTPDVAWTRKQEVAVLDRIHSYHLEPHWYNWRGELVSLGGFAYQLAVFPSRRAYLVTPLRMRGAHVANNNGHLVAVLLAGTFTDYAPLPAHLETAVQARLYAEGELGKPLIWKGHREWAEPDHPTACPGRTYAEWGPGFSGSQEVRTVYTDAQIDAGFKGVAGQIAALAEDVAALQDRPAPAPPPTPAPRTYVVKGSDGAEGLSGIALRQLGDAGRWPEIASINGLSPPYTIHMGQRLYLPAQ